MNQIQITENDKQIPRKILLIEPNYKNKYPPLGLMKISAYHKILKDEVTFFKGNENEYIFNEKFNACIKKIKNSFTRWYIFILLFVGNSLIQIIKN